MTKTLRDYFLTIEVPDTKILVVPHTIELEKFEIRISDSKMSLPNDYIAYLGPLNQQKDGILTLVESFAKVAAKYPEMHLLIAGVGTQQEKNELSSLITQLHLDERVHYLGRISSNEIPAFFHGAKLLVSCRRKSFQNEYSFPTKVVEYLATGKPTVTTAPGDLAFYLNDRVNAFVADMDETSTFASKMLEALQDYEFALKVGQNGKELVKDEFNPIKQVKKIIDFCKE